MSIQKTIKAIRKNKNMTQEDVARAAEITKDYFSKLERGDEQNPTIGTLHKIAKALDVDLYELLGGLNGADCNTLVETSVSQ